MEKCGNDSAHAGESNASITGPVGLLRTQPPSVLSIHPHHIGFSQKLRTHTHMGSVFRSTTIDGGKSTEIQKNVEKCAFASAHRVGPRGVEFQIWVTSSISASEHPTLTASTPHCPSRLCSIIGDFAKMNKNRKKYGKMCITLGACGGVECNLRLPDWPSSHPATHPSSPPSPPHWVMFDIVAHGQWKINRNSEKCEKMCIRLGARGWPGWCRYPTMGVVFVPHLQASDPLGVHTTLSRLKFLRLCKNK